MVMLKGYRLLAILFLSLIQFSSHAISKVVMSVDTNPVVINQYFQLNISVDDHVTNNAINLDHLSQDFRVLQTSVSTKMRMVNGSTNKETIFSTKLIPLRSGDLVIPPVTVNGVNSNMLRLKILKATPQNSPSFDEDFFVKTELSEPSVWLNQQVIYTVRLYINAQAPLREGSLSQPDIDSAIIEQIGKDKENDTLLNGKRFRVIERQFTIAPQKSGSFILKSPVFEGEVVVGRNRSRLFGQTKPVVALGNEQTLIVKAIPASYQGDWLPSDLVTLHEELTPLNGYTVGEPLTRIITITALNVDPELLPELKINYPNTFKVYPDKAKTQSGHRQNQLISQRVETSALIPNQAGKLTLPEVKLNWWNTKTQKMETATLPSRTIEVAKGQIQQTTAAPSALQPASTSSDSYSGDNKNVELIEVNKPWALNNLSIAFLLLWLVTAILWFVHIQNQNPTSNNKIKTQKPNEALAEKKAWQQLNKALKAKDRTVIQNALLAWLNSINKTQAASLSQALSASKNEDLNNAIAAMQAASFAKKADRNWSPTSLNKVLHKLRESYYLSEQQTDKSEKAGLKLAKLHP